LLSVDVRRLRGRLDCGVEVGIGPFGHPLPGVGHRDEWKDFRGVTAIIIGDVERMLLPHRIPKGWPAFLEGNRDPRVRQLLFGDSRQIAGSEAKHGDQWEWNRES